MGQVVIVHPKVRNEDLTGHDVRSVSFFDHGNGELQEQKKREDIAIFQCEDYRYRPIIQTLAFVTFDADALVPVVYP